MRKPVFIIFLIVVAVYLSGCGKKEELQEQMAQEPLTMDSLGVVTTDTKTGMEPKIIEIKPQVAQPMQSMGAGGEAIPVVTASRPSAKDIQTALKNAKYYLGAIDGKIGPKTKKAIEEFQMANNLKADGKVGPQTWAALSAYLDMSTIEPVVEKSRKR